MMLKKFPQLLILGTALIAGHAKADDCGIALLQSQFRNLLSEKNELLKQRESYLRSLGPMAAALDTTYGQGTSSTGFDGRIQSMSNDIKSTLDHLKMAIELKKMGVCR